MIPISSFRVPHFVGLCWIDQLRTLVLYIYFPPNLAQGGIYLPLISAMSDMKKACR
jgi:hypothetical protein